MRLAGFFWSVVADSSNCRGGFHKTKDLEPCGEPSSSTTKTSETPSSSCDPKGAAVSRSSRGRLQAETVTESPGRGILGLP